MQVNTPYASELSFCFFPHFLGGALFMLARTCSWKSGGAVQLISSKDTRGNSTLLKVRHVMQMPKLTANLFKVHQWSVENKKRLSQKQPWDLNSLRGRLTVEGTWKCQPLNLSIRYLSLGGANTLLPLALKCLGTASISCYFLCHQLLWPCEVNGHR